MSGFLGFVYDSGFVGWCIIALGIGTLALMFERIYVLYFKYGMDAETFSSKIHSLILGKKIDEALVVCAQLSDKPFANAYKTIIEKSDRDDETIFQAHDNAMASTVPLYTRKLHYLSMLANVATLMGLLGTIHGLILSFQAVAQADPSTKQALLAQGISVSMYTTALGLAVAIPAMVAFSFLVSRQNSLVEQLTEKCGKLTELLTGAHVPNLNKETVFPNQLSSETFSQKAPPPNHRAS